ncbi:MAG: ribonuclease HII [Thermodesulfobacteriota bacterium]
MPRPKRLWPESPALDRFVYERSLREQGYLRIAGTDEVGRGPLAGPVVAACVILPPECDPQRYRDSKQLSHAQRVTLAEELKASGALIGVGMADAAEIDRLNILQASLLAMRLAVENLPLAPDFLLVDGRHTLPLAIPQQAVIRGDSRSASIAAASIIAKVARDALMDAMHQEYPHYNFQRHKGYGTAEHCRLLRLHGPCLLHRRSFRPVREALAKGEE